VPGDSVWAIVVAGGAGRRYGRTKQFELLAGRPLHAWAVEAARSVAHGVVLVLPAQFEVEALEVDLEGGPPGAPGRSSARSHRSDRPDIVVTGGETRAASVRAGLRAVPTDAGVIVVHDAARPLASPSLFEAVVREVRSGASGVVPGLGVPDTVKRVEGRKVRATIDRRDLVRVQTPQGFRARTLREAHAGEPEATDDSSLLEAIGIPVVVVEGEEHNLKITTPPDLALAEWWLKQRAATGAAGTPTELGAE
jgi:2-C-methyl-D-erythritol 4-phosphate cytidylyltransferase